MHPKVTVLTCVYNGLPYLKEAIESTLNQTYKDFEYLIIDDFSPDINVVKLIESYDICYLLFKRTNFETVSKLYDRCVFVHYSPRSFR
jgi:glycosyltransferase involved in cell wall biosynthesis